MSYEKEQERIRQLALLCLETRELTDEELDQVIASSKDIWIYLSYRQNFVYTGAERVKRYRLRRAELNKLPTQKLEQMGDEINQERSAILAADFDDDLPDSFFEAPPINSDEHIVHELLEERRKRATVKK